MGHRGLKRRHTFLGRHKQAKIFATTNGTNHLPKENSFHSTLLLSNRGQLTTPEAQERYNRANAETKCATNLPPRCSEPKHTLPPPHNSTAGACWKDTLPSYSRISNPATDKAIMLRAQGAPQAHRFGNRAPN